MAVKRKYRLNLRNYGNLPAIMLSQYDEGYALEFEIRDGTEAASDLSAYTVTLKGTRADTLAYSFAGTIATNVLTFVIDTTMTACAGRGTAEIAIKDTANDVLFATFNMPVFVERAAVPEGSIDADVERAQEIAEEVEELIDGATEGAEAWAVGQRGGVDVESTDETYHNNAKYYAEQAETAAESIGIDATLTQTGKAADAKKTGDELTSVKEGLSDLQNEFDNAFIQEVPFDLVWSQGNISDSTGQPGGTSVGAIRTDALYDVSEQTKINVVYNNGTYPSSIVFTVYLYDETQTFLSRVGKYAGTYEIDVSTASYVRFKVVRNDSVTEISPSDGNTLVQATKRDVEELASKPYVDGKVNPLIPVVENLSAQKAIKTVSLAWQNGKLSDSGSGSQSSSTTFIRNVYAIPITAESVTLTVPSGFKADVHFYSYYATSNSTHYATIKKNLTGTNTITVPTGYRYIRMVLTRVDGTDISLSDGDLVILTYIDGDLGSASTSYVNSHPEYISLAMFEKIGVIGDSFASGTIYLNGGNTSEYNLSWPQVIGRKIGAEVTNYTEGGLSTKDWLTDANHGLPALLADTAKQLYILALGINDNTQINDGTLALGTLADITSDYTQNPESFYGNYGRIVGNILAHAPKAKIVILSIARPTERQMDTHLSAIAEKLELPYIQLTDDSYFESGLFYGSMSGNHPLAYGYAGMANAIQRLLETGIANNTTYFADYTG